MVEWTFTGQFEKFLINNLTNDNITTRILSDLVFPKATNRYTPFAKVHLLILQTRHKPVGSYLQPWELYHPTAHGCVVFTCTNILQRIGHIPLLIKKSAIDG